METCTYKVMVRRTVQVKQYEPTVVEFSVEGTCPRGELTAEYDKAYDEIKAEMKKVFGIKSTSGYLD